MEITALKGLSAAALWTELSKAQRGSPVVLSGSPLFLLSIPATVVLPGYVHQAFMLGLKLSACKVCPGATPGAFMCSP